MISGAMFQKNVTEYLEGETPFIFLIDYAKENKEAYTFEEARKEGIYVCMKGIGNHLPFSDQNLEKPGPLKYEKVEKGLYSKAFHHVKRELALGNSFLLNLTFATKITAKASLKDIYTTSKAPFKLLYKDVFTVFSPEAYLHFQGDHVYAYPMKALSMPQCPKPGKNCWQTKKSSTNIIPLWTFYGTIYP